MKKLFIFLFSICLSLTSLTACSGSEEVVDPIYSEELSYNEAGHFYAQLNGNGMKGYKPHKNSKGKCYECGYYFPTNDLEYVLKYNMVEGKPQFYYAVSKYISGQTSDAHIEVPLMHRQDAPVYKSTFDEDYDPIIAEYKNTINLTKYPVLEILEQAFYKSGVESIKLNEGLKTIGDGAFAYTLIRELVIPNSVEGKIAEICVGCNSLKNVVIGDGITLMDYYNFTYCAGLETVKFSKNTVEIRERNFFGAQSLKYLVIPKSVISIPESQIWTKNVQKYVVIHDQFQGGLPPSQGIFLEISEKEYNALYLPLLERDSATGLTLDPVTKKPIPFEEFEYTHYGYVSGWSSSAKLYFLGEWEYDENGVPKPLVEKN